MRRQEKRKQIIYIILAALLVISIPLCYVRLISASREMDSSDVVDYSGVKPQVTDRNDRLISENETLVNDDIYGNTVGVPGFMANTLVSLYQEELAPVRVNPLLGYRTVETEPRVMKTTLLGEEAQQMISDAFGGQSGCCFAFNYETGEIYTALSFPSFDLNKPESERGYINRCFTSPYIPGSTMKVLTTALAADQGLDLAAIRHTCSGQETLPDGKTVDCTARHGDIGFSDALGMSCNCYFAHVAGLLDLEQALASLKQMGFDVDKQQESAPEFVDRFAKFASRTDIGSTATFSDVWSFIGQGTTQVGAVDMAMIAAAVVNNGKTATPYMVESVINPNKKGKAVYSIPEEVEVVNLMSPTTSKITKDTWKNGVDTYYYAYQDLSEKIDYAKTGTAQQTDGSRNKLLIGVIEKSKTAFYIVVEHYQNGGVMPVDVANRLAEVLPSFETTVEE